MLPEVELRVRATGRHPWFYRRMVRKPQKRIAAGGVVHVKDKVGRNVGTGFHNHRTELVLRMFSDQRLSESQVATEVLRRLDAAINLRHDLLDLPAQTTGYRLVHGEGDGLPGLILDRLGNCLVAQVRAACIEPYLESIGERLLQHFPGSQLQLTVDPESRKLEGLQSVPPPGSSSTIEVQEHNLVYHVQPGGAHKTGFFADQREHRRRAGGLAKGRRVLDLCCNSGGFAMAACRGGAKNVVAVDLDEDMVAQTQVNLHTNRLSAEVRHGDAFDILRDLKPGTFDFIILDPPKWIRSSKEIELGLKRYLDLNRLAMQQLPTNGLLLTCSCSGALSEARFLAMLRQAGEQIRRDFSLLHVGGAGPDHPVAVECAETRYLKVATLLAR